MVTTSHLTVLKCADPYDAPSQGPLIDTECADKEKRILEAASVLFNRFGIKKTTVDEIAKLAKVGKGTIYLYFADKEEIFLTVERRNIDTFIAALQIAADNQDCPKKKLEAVLKTHFDMLTSYAKKRPQNMDIYLEYHTQPEYKTLNDEFSAKEDALIAELLQKGVEAKVFQVADIDKAVWVLRQFILGISVSLVKSPDFPHLQQRIDDLGELFLNGILSRN